MTGEVHERVILATFVSIILRWDAKRRPEGPRRHLHCSFR